ncbi:hypothetical protein C0993_002704 [Termitomyces sp. T159_Od127]|nr:hypothetical protein C0993_002704 [Termitomyces sp. T159_Od127]
MPETPPSTWAPLALAHASAAFFAPGQYYAQPAPALPPPLQDYPETYYIPWPRPSIVPPIHTLPSPLGCQQVEAYIQQCDNLNVFSAPATHLCTTALSLDTLSAHLFTQSSQTLLLCTTLLSFSALVNTLINSGATNNFIDKSLVMLAAMPWRLSLPIHLTLFDSSSTSTSDITHYVQTTLTFANVLTALINSKATRIFVSDQLDLTHNLLDRPMELQLFNSKPTTAGPITKTHSSSIVLNNSLRFPINLLVTQLSETTPIILGLPWLCNINPDINWRDLTMKFPGPGACLTAVHLCLQPTNDPSKAGAIGALTVPLDDSGDPPPP